MFDNKIGDKTYLKEIPIKSRQQISFVFDDELISESDQGLSIIFVMEMVKNQASQYGKSYICYLDCLSEKYIHFEIYLTIKSSLTLYATLMFQSK